MTEGRARTTRRAAIAGASALLGSQTMGRPAIAQARTPVLATCYGGVFEAAVRESIPKFEAENPYSVSLVVSDDANTVPRLLAARGRSPFDVVCLNDDTAIVLRAQGLLAPDQSAVLRNLSDTYDSMKPPRSAVYGMTVYEFDLVYRTAAFQSPPTSWQDLWQPGLAVGIPFVGQPYGMTFLYIAAMLNGGSADNLAPGFAAIKRLSKYKVYNNVGQGLTLFQQGEIDAAFYYAHRGQQMITMGLPVARVRPKEGVYGQKTGVQIPRGAPNMAGAIAWVDYNLSQVIQGRLAAQFYSPANRTVQIPAALADNYIVGEDAVARLRDPPWEKLLPQRSDLMDTWRRELG
jgi:putative spermidine/putrescine transport system substrate-binding protein